ncbi:unnamed protein product (macronuclear) [Paramecium tetraurelia]|uniref:Transmembrane protein n=1 Tax=Paramecium tetraurelia TaxID=5888 RepID=A0C666_PARTE|nr:uncharacterized protein GSPATT00035412001 [Paramecium tetraurelia]CAK66283.1 unnamed protein product [Paramecium tetraurelia]|eukprot:XP_001433680.1 hypothetical protein (macronuclear) [Paramecium tetraurelia strain d4-2]
MIIRNWLIYILLQYLISNSQYQNDQRVQKMNTQMKVILIFKNQHQKNTKVNYKLNYDSISKILLLSDNRILKCFNVFTKIKLNFTFNFLCTHSNYLQAEDFFYLYFWLAQVTQCSYQPLFLFALSFFSQKMQVAIQSNNKELVPNIKSKQDLNLLISIVYIHYENMAKTYQFHKLYQQNCYFECYFNYKNKICQSQSTVHIEFGILIRFMQDSYKLERYQSLCYNKMKNFHMRKIYQQFSENICRVWTLNSLQSLYYKFQRICLKLNRLILDKIYRVIFFSWFCIKLLHNLISSKNQSFSFTLTIFQKGKKVFQLLANLRVQIVESKGNDESIEKQQVNKCQEIQRRVLNPTAMTCKLIQHTKMAVQKIQQEATYHYKVSAQNYQKMHQVDITMIQKDILTFFQDVQSFTSKLKKQIQNIVFNEKQDQFIHYVNKLLQILNFSFKCLAMDQESLNASFTTQAEQMEDNNLLYENFTRISPSLNAAFAYCLSYYRMFSNNRQIVLEKWIETKEIMDFANNAYIYSLTPINLLIRQLMLGMFIIFSTPLIMLIMLLSCLKFKHQILEEEVDWYIENITKEIERTAKEHCPSFFQPVAEQAPLEVRHTHAVINHSLEQLESIAAKITPANAKDYTKETERYTWCLTGMVPLLPDQEQDPFKQNGIHQRWQKARKKIQQIVL